MTPLYFSRLLTPEGWRDDVSLKIADGRIATMQPGRLPGAESHRIGIPGVPNLHSHAFQRGMSGLAETSGFGPDTFWTWREVMYRFALSMSPDDVEAVAAQLYVEMLEAGFTRVGEFHYLHHDRDGSPYADPAEMAARIAAASVTAGINLTLLPVHYRQGGFGGVPAQPQQRRFLNDLDGFARLVSASESVVAGVEGANIGIAPHSLRAVTPDDLAAVVRLAGDRPIHIHAAEQVREVEDCVAWSGQRPVEWLLRNADVDSRWCLIHATHMTPAEAGDLARRGATAGLCPVTEGNLGDGLFPGSAFLSAGGHFGIGTDSNVSIDAADELRQFEYSQRLRSRGRNVVSIPGESTGLQLLQRAVSGGHRALGRTHPGICEGAVADIVSLDPALPAIAGHDVRTVLDAWIFGRRPLVDCVWARGIKRVEHGRHISREAVARRFGAVMRRLAS